MQVGTWLMVGFCIVWFALFGYFTWHDIKAENKKNAIIASGEEVDPFLFSGEKAREEARQRYESDPIAKKYFEELDIVKYLEKK